MALELIGQTLTPNGIDMKLTRRANEYIILANGKSLMSSRMHGSEEALATLACRRVRTLEQPCVLVGGLGMGFTLRATLDFLPPDAMVIVAGDRARCGGVEPWPARALGGATPEGSACAG